MSGSLGRCSGGSAGPPFAAHWAAVFTFYLWLTGPLLFHFAAHWAAALAALVGRLCGSLGHCFLFAAHWAAALAALLGRLCGSLGRRFHIRSAAHWAAAFEFYLRLTGPLLWRLCRAACAALIGLWADLFVSRNRGSLGLPLAAACAIGCVGLKVSLIRRSLVDMLLFE